MLTDAGLAGSDDWYVRRLGDKLGEGLPRMERIRRYRDGDALVPEQAWEGAPTNAAGYVSFVKRNRLHVVETLRDARTNRQRPIGFRTAAAGDEEGDKAAWANWVRSNMQVASRNFLNDVADFGSAFLTVTGSALPGTGAFANQYADPIMARSNGWNTATEQFSARDWMTEAAIRVGYDPVLRVETINLFRPGYMRIAYRRTDVPTLPNDGSPWSPGNEWTWASDPMPLGYTRDCPVVRLDTADGFGIYEKHLDSVDRVNEITLQASTLIILQSFRQRAIDGDLPEFYPAEHQKAGERIDYDDLFKSGPAALWLLPKDAKMWESAAVDVTPVVNARKDELKNLFSMTSTPHYALSPDNANQTAMGAALSREMLVFTVENSNDRAERAFALAHSLGFQAQRDGERADATQIETIWAAVERSSISEKGVAAKDAKQGGATQRWIDEHIFGMSPAELAQARIDRTEETFRAAVAAGVAPALAGAAAAGSGDGGGAE
ncbi:hypothetical protein MN032_11085 [Agromyces atrinae]|uniref:hypothetical protein n=1 Tax=Agromyces atrinae TaxID=592376 RepID=UPI001F5924C5|nr:hypothetical protein [Agromyces atrinae]MCI2958242.1 hypothetical protein [Agromyces atrinae]